jgi:hypothetical protein
MPSFEVKIDDKTYHVDIPWLGAKPLPVIVAGHPLELVIGGPQGVTAQETKEAEMRVGPRVITPVNGKPIVAEWHASIQEE